MTAVMILLLVLGYGAVGHGLMLGVDRHYGTDDQKKELSVAECKELVLKLETSKAIAEGKEFAGANTAVCDE